MPRTPATERLVSPEILARHRRALLRRNPQLRAIAQRAGAFDIRLTPGGFGGLVRVICGQQVSVASARAMWGRLAALDGALDPAGYLGLPENAARTAGLSAGKHRTITALAQAIVAGDLDLAALETLPAAEAVAALTAQPGIGPWTAEIYLMFCLGHADIFPAGDLALQKAVGHALGMKAPPDARALAELAAPWAPHRHTAALLFWRYYAAVLRKAGGVAL
ncbi:MAG: DNA-3-methyladenine glycosylase 2 family protein [Devosia sp.]